ncbi:MAG TPA: M6 family metalloprotease domain-containing protein [Paludibacter sp.]|nr:M6 family metalloprotease domain-containing protein [Paludibacter sp.]
MKNKYYHILFTAVLLLTINNLYAIKASPYPISITQKDGTQISYYIKGDEFFHYKTTLDNYAIVPDEKGIFNYGIQNSEGRLISSGVKVNEINRRTTGEKNFIKTQLKDIDVRSIRKAQISNGRSNMKSALTAEKAYPLAGTPKSLVILVNFADKSYITPDPKTAFTNLLNQQGYSANGGTGSARDYFRDASNGVFNPQFDVVGPYTMNKTMAYYGENVSDQDKDPRQMVIDACTLADADGVDFTQYDTDNNGYVDNIFIYYAGNNEAEGAPANTIWPHRWGLSNNNTKFDGKTIQGYACTSELRGAATTTMCGIGTFCHEFGHVLGLVDYYITSGSSNHQTLSYWNIMDAGAYLNMGRTPPTYSAFDRFYLNWLTPIELKTPQNVELNALNTSNKAYIITQNGDHNLNGSNPYPVEFLTLENRQRTGWDSYLPGHGLIVSRIFYNASSWYSNEPNNNDATQGYDIIEADGLASDNNLGGDPFPGTQNVNTYSPKLRLGTSINKPLTLIKETNGVITFRFMGGSGTIPSITTKNIINNFTTVHGTPSAVQTLIVNGKKLIADIQISFSNKIHFEIKKSTDPESAWAKSLTLTPNADSIVADAEIQIRYNPTEPSYSDFHNDILSLTSAEAEKVTMSFIGISTRPVYVVPPVANEATEVTMGSFIANWNAVNDASGYYLTAYFTTNDNSEITQGFDNGLTAPLGWTITANAVSSSADFSGKAIPAIQFKNIGDYIQTEEYILPPATISYYAKSLSGSDGYLLTHAWDGNKWTKIDSLSVTSTLAQTKTLTLGADNNYKRFKFTYFKGSGYLVVDDITASFTQKIELILDNKWVTATTDTLINLLSDKDYFYKIKASDKTYNFNNSIKYENITAFSNIIPVKTLKDLDAELLLAIPESDGSIKIIVPTTEGTIYIYNALGQKLRAINPVSNIIRITDLPKNQLYILQFGKRRAKIAL